ncbi:hypothetical protein BESB_083690 [Besnoitia besnoiti]|uniref:Condensin complex subunit 1 C-terminal domain-containing protein n=1 Tax=Besnoitia besnoiti TaxID=94643 RepID=A0A2A9MCP4_BESBE|nr:hypothetical protein BESB_083690 [Besnoitia besnoiti]PFH33170.1 hypothetical protein BESB_083690 [Besnoitia besnoiti]
MALSETPGLLESLPPPHRRATACNSAAAGLDCLCVFVPPSSGDPKALERAPAFEAFAASFSSGAASSEARSASSDFPAHGEGILWSGDSCPARPEEWSNEEYAAALARLRRLVDASASAAQADDSLIGENLLNGTGGSRYGAWTCPGTPPPNRRWKHQEDGRRRETPGGLQAELEESAGALNILTQEGFRLLYSLSKCFSPPSDGGEGDSCGYSRDGLDSPSCRRDRDLQASFLELLARVCSQIATLVEALPSRLRPDGHGPTLRLLCARQQGGASDLRRRRRGFAQSEEDGDEEFSDAGVVAFFGEDGERDEGLCSAESRNGARHTHPRAFASPLVAGALASGVTVLDAARVLRSLLLCGVFFADWLVGEALRDIEEGPRGDGDSELERTGRGRGGRRFASSVRSRHKSDGLPGSVRSASSHARTRGGAVPIRAGKRKRNEQMEVDLEETSSPGAPAVFDDDEDLACLEPRDEAPSARRRGLSSGVGVQLASLLGALSEIARSRAAWRAFDSDFGGERKDEDRHRFFVLRALMRPLHVLYDEEKIKSHAQLQAVFLAEDGVGEKLRTVIKRSLVALLETIETRREAQTLARREVKKRQREEEERRKAEEKARVQEELRREMQDVSEGEDGAEAEKDAEDNEGGEGEGGDESKAKAEDEQKKESEAEDDDGEDDEEEEGQLSWRSQLNSILLQPECKALIEVLTAPTLRRRRLPSLVLRELTQQLKEQLLLSGGVDKATAAQKKSFSCAATSLECFASLLPRVWISEKATLLQLFAADAYHIRKALLECLKALLLRAHRVVDLEEEECDEGGDGGDVSQAAREGDTSETAEVAEVAEEAEEVEDEDANGRPRRERGGKTPSAAADGEEEKLLRAATHWGDDDGASAPAGPSRDARLEASAAQRLQRTRAFWSAERASLIRELLLRLDDRTPLARTWALKVLADLIGEQEALPTLFVVQSAQKAVRRLLDKSTLVRSAAIGVFSALIHLAVKQQRAGCRESPDQPFLWLLVNGEEEWDLVMQRVKQRRKERRRREERKRREAEKKRDAHSDESEVEAAQASASDEQGDAGKAADAEEPRKEEAGEEAEVMDFEDLAVQAEEALRKAVDICQELLFSRSEGDQKASLRFLIDCCLLLQLRRRRLLPALQKALRLAFSRSAVVADLLLLEFYRLFLEPKSLEEQQIILRDHFALRRALAQHEAVALALQDAAAERGRRDGKGAEEKGDKRRAREQQQSKSFALALSAITKGRGGLLGGGGPPLRPLEKLLLHTEISPTVNGVFRFGAGRLLELVEEGDMACLACIEKLFFLTLSKEGGCCEHRAALKKAADALFSIAMQPNFLLGRDATPRCALGLLRLLFQASRQTAHAASHGAAGVLSALPSEASLGTPLLRRKDEAPTRDAVAALHRLSNGQLLALQGAIVRQLKAPASGAATSARVRRLRPSPATSDGGVRFLIVAELCRILAASLPDRRTTKAAVVALEALMAHYGTADPNWFSAAQAVIDVTFAHCARPEELWSQLLSHLLGHLLRAPSSADAGAPASRPPGSSTSLSSSLLSQPSTPFASSAPVSAAAVLPAAPCRLPASLCVREPSLYQLAHLVFLAGHVALRICILLEQQQSDVKQERSEMQRRAMNRRQGKGEVESRKGEGEATCGKKFRGEQDPGADPASEPEEDDGAAAAARQGGNRSDAAMREGGTGARGDDDDGELQTVEGNMGMQTREEEEAELFTHILETQIVGAGLLGRPLKRLILVAALEPQRLLARRPSSEDRRRGGAPGDAQPRSEDALRGANGGVFTPLRKAQTPSLHPFAATPRLIAGAPRGDEEAAHGAGRQPEGASSSSSFSAFSALSPLSSLEDSPSLATLHAAAVIALCKFATISRTFCESRICKTTSVLHALISLLFSQATKTPNASAVPSAAPPTAKGPSPAGVFAQAALQTPFPTKEKEPAPSGNETTQPLKAEYETQLIPSSVFEATPLPGRRLEREEPEASQTRHTGEEATHDKKERVRLPSALRQTLLVCYADLTCRHPNVLEPYNDVVFNILVDGDARVRLAGVQVFTHLVMNGMVKPKGRLLVLMLQLLRDRDARICAAAETFFYEVERKGGHAIVNSLPELLGALAGAGDDEDASAEDADASGDSAESASEAPVQETDSDASEADEQEREEGEERGSRQKARDSDVAEGDPGETAKDKETRGVAGSAEAKKRKEQERLVTFLLQFVKHHRHSEALIEKFCQRIAALPIPKLALSEASLGRGSQSQARGSAAAPSPPLSPSRAGRGSRGDAERAASARRVYFQAISAVCLASPNLEKALRRLASSFPLLRFAVAAREEGGGEEILKDLLRRVSIKISGRWGGGASAPAGRGGDAGKAGRGDEEAATGDGDRPGSAGSPSGGAQDVALIREVVEELQKKLQAATEDATEKPPAEEAMLAEGLDELSDGEETGRNGRKATGADAGWDEARGDADEAGSVGVAPEAAAREKRPREEASRDDAGEAAPASARAGRLRCN